MARKRGTNNDDKDNKRGLNNVRKRPDAIASNKKDARPDKDLMEQGQGPVDGANGDVSTGRQRMSVPTEDDDVSRRH